MKKIILLCISMLVFVTASAFENGGKQKFEPDRFVLLEHSQVQTIVFENQATFIPVVALSAERPILIEKSIYLFTSQILPLSSPEKIKIRDVGWRIDNGVNYNLSNLSDKSDNSPYKNYLRVYRCRA